MNFEVYIHHCYINVINIAMVIINNDKNVKKTRCWYDDLFQTVAILTDLWTSCPGHL